MARHAIKGSIWLPISAIMMFVCICAPLAAAGDYYVDQGHPAASDQNPGTIDLPWRTLTKPNSSLQAGDTVHIKAGTYTTYISPSNSGTSTARIVFRNFGSDNVTIQNTAYGVYLNGKSYITIQGINFYNCDRFMYLQNGASYNTIAGCSFDQARLVNGTTATWGGSKIYRDSRYNRVHNCRFSKYGYYTDDDKGCVIDIGDENTTSDATSHNLIENSRFFHGGHHVMGVYGKYNVIRNNYFHNEPWALGTTASDRGAVLYGNRNLSFAGYEENSGRNLFDGNKVAYSADPPDNVGSSGMSLTTSSNIIRFNSFYHNDLAGLSLTLTSSYVQNIRFNKIFHNSFFNNGHNPDGYIRAKSGIFIAIYSGARVIENNVIKNNIFYKHRAPLDEYNINTADRRGLLTLQQIESNWDGDAQGDPKFLNAATALGDPMDEGRPDLRVPAESPCIDRGTHLTTITSPGGTGASFQVGDAGYFIDGWGIAGVEGDEIQLNGTSQTARITQVNYTNNTITVDRNLTWTQNQGISLKYEGSAPDLGAFELNQNSINPPENLRIVGYLLTE